MAKSVFDSYKRLISIRINEEAFNPFGKFNFLDLGDKVFAIDNVCAKGVERIIAIHNFSNEEVICTLPENIKLPLYDILSTNYAALEKEKTEKTREFKLEPYQIMWLKGTI